SAGNDGSRRDGAVAVGASRTSSAPPRGLSSPTGAGRASRSSPAPPRGLSSPAGAGRASRSSPAPPRGRSSPARSLDPPLAQAPIRRGTRGAALSASRHTHPSTRNTGRERLKRIEDHLCQGARVVKVAGSGSEWPGDIRFDPFATNLFAL